MKELFEKTIEKWGQRAQLEMAQEEATELALAVRKFLRKNDTTTYDAMASEIADVEIMIEQIKIMFPNIQEKIDSEKEFKLERLKHRIENSSFE